MTATYLDVVYASYPHDVWPLNEASGTDFAPVYGSQHLTGTGVNLYQQTGPFASYDAVHLNPGKLLSPVSLPFLFYFSTEAWFKPDGVSAGGTRILMWIGGNSATEGWGAYLPAANNHLHILAAPSGPDLDTGYVLPTSTWTLVQLANLSGNAGEIDVAVNGELLGRIVTAGSGSPTGYGFGGEASRASNYSGLLALPAVYTQQQSQQSLRSRFTASSDPDAGLVQTLSGFPTLTTDYLASADAVLAEILAAVKKSYTA